MNQEATFIYNYSAKENKEVQEIRKKYLPQEESNLDELKRLDSAVQTSGMMESLCAGIGGALIFGMGLCLTMKIIGNGIFFMIIGVLLGIVGMIGMLSAYPVYRRVFNKTKAKYSPRILELLCGHLVADEGKIKLFDRDHTDPGVRVRGGSGIYSCVRFDNTGGSRGVSL